MNLTFDWEVTTNNKGNVHDQRNKAVCIGLKRENQETQCLFSFENLQQVVDESSLLIGFNLKFDCAWLRRMGITYAHKRLWDTQLAEFILSGQTERFPSLEQTAIKYGLGHKVDVVKLEYWDKGIDTDCIPQPILSEYCVQDVDLTYQIYLLQLEQFKQQPQLFRLFKLACQDLLVLEEMEWNGLKYNPELCKERSEELSIEIEQLQKQLSSVYPDIPINFGSGDQLSAFLYGGTIYEDIKVADGTYGPKAQKAGQVKWKTVTKEHVLPRLVEPLKKSETKKEGVFKTDEGTLRKLKGAAAKKFVAPLLRLAELDKLVGTYYRGLPQLAETMHWPQNMIHGSFHQVVAQTGRLSSSNPNLQNFAGACEDIFITRYAS